MPGTAIASVLLLQLSLLIFSCFISHCCDAVIGDEPKPQVDTSLAEAAHVKVTSRAKSVDVSKLFDHFDDGKVASKQRKHSSAASKTQSKARRTSAAGGQCLSYSY